MRNILQTMNIPADQEKPTDNIRMLVERKNNLKNRYTSGILKEIPRLPKKQGCHLFARYGFGDVIKYEAVIDAPLELLNILK